MSTTEKATKTQKSLQEKKTIELIVEPHPLGYAGFPFITLIQYRKVPMLVIIDNVGESVVRTFVLDLCGPEEVDEDQLISVVTEWYNNSRTLYPISVEFSKRGLTPITSKIYRALNIEFISRIIGPAPKYPTSNENSIKRRRRKPVPLMVPQQMVL